MSFIPLRGNTERELDVDIWFACILQRLVYLEDGPAKSRICQHVGLQSIHRRELDVNNQTIVEIWEFPNGHYLVFHGTRDLEQLIGQMLGALNTSSSDYPGLVNPVYIADANACWEALSDILQADNNRLVAFAGHSYGGAIASLLSWRLYNHDADKVAQVITFGSPRIGNYEFAKTVSDNMKIQRVYQYRDPVPFVPPQMVVSSNPLQQLVVGQVFNEFAHTSPSFRLEPDGYMFREQGVNTPDFWKASYEWRTMIPSVIRSHQHHQINDYYTRIRLGHNSVGNAGVRRDVQRIIEQNNILAGHYGGRIPAPDVSTPPAPQQSDDGPFLVLPTHTVPVPEPILVLPPDERGEEDHYVLDLEPPDPLDEHYVLDLIPLNPNPRRTVPEIGTRSTTGKCFHPYERLISE